MSYLIIIFATLATIITLCRLAHKPCYLDEDAQLREAEFEHRHAVYSPHQD